MKIDDNQIADHNNQFLHTHQQSFDFLGNMLTGEGFDVEYIIKKIQEFQVAIPSWALGTGGTRFGRFPEGGEPGTLEEKIKDIGVLHAMNKSSGAVSLHIPWDIPDDPDGVKQLADSLKIKFDAVNSNTFQDQPDQKYSYKFGSLSHIDKKVRDQAVAHNKEVIDYGKALGSRSITIWLADGSSFPGQHNFRKAFQNTFGSLKEIYGHLPDDWQMFVEYKPYEPYFYSTVIQDWGTSHLLASKLGPKAYCLVDLGHHLPNTNIEQIVATLLMEGKLGGFHFNDSKYGDDDLTTGSIKPYQLFLIFNELVEEFESNQRTNPDLSWMIDASHNLKDPLEDLLQSVNAILIAYARALLVNREQLESAQLVNDVTRSQEILQHAFRTDVRPLVKEACRRSGAAMEPLQLFRSLEVRKQLINERGKTSVATGL